tara:strand:+ start:112 stop:615 length:504 start_codon:yes stop_codon:yes gene_type:complete
LSGIENIKVRVPSLEDGMAVFQLIESCPPLDRNSSYCNLLQCGHFAQTSVIAETTDEIMGFVSAYVIPDRPNTLFIWQVAVSEQARGVGLASQMLAHILDRPHCGGIVYIETTITADNSASWALFKRFAAKRSADFQSSEWLDEQTHFAGQHDSEALVRIGPINSRD